MFSSLFLAQNSTFWQRITGEKVECIVNGVPTLKCFEAVFANLIFAASGLVLMILFVMFVFGAFLYLTSGGNPERVKKAQSTLKFALLGFFIFLSAFLIIRIIAVLFLEDPKSLFEFKIP